MQWRVEKRERRGSISQITAERAPLDTMGDQTSLDKNMSLDKNQGCRGYDPAVGLGNHGRLKTSLGFVNISKFARQDRNDRAGGRLDEGCGL